MSISRRSFLETAALGTVTAGALTADTTSISKTTLPTRPFGRDGVRVAILAMGGGSRFLQYATDELAAQAINRALDSGINYLDTAYSYSSGKSESRIGMVMATRRKEVVLADKIGDRNGDAAERRIEGSLKRLQTDYVDVAHIHSLTDDEDLAAIEAPDGVLKRFLKLRDQKIIRNVGITSHTDPAVLAKALGRNDFDCTQMALNAARVGMMGATGGMVINPAMKMSFETIALPVALKKKMSVIAMKVFAADGLVGQASAEKLMYYSLSLPVSLCVVGMQKLEFIDENVKLAKAFKPLPKAEMEAMGSTLSDKNKAALDYFLHHHVDEYTAA